MKVYKLRKDPRSSDEVHSASCQARHGILLKVAVSSQRLYFLQLSILQKRKANDSELVQAIQALISHLVFNEASVNR